MAEGRKIAVRGKRYPGSSDDGCVIVDEQFYDLLSTKTFGWDTKGYVSVRVDSKLVFLHRYIYGTLLGQELAPGLVIHHKNDKKYDNRVENLELTSHSHNNAAVTRKTETTTSKYKGVHRASGGWVTMISRSKTTINLGTAVDETAAAKKYDEAFVAIHGSATGRNGILTQDEIDHILSRRQEFIPRPKRHDRILPKHITNHQGNFRVRIRRGEEVLHQGVFKTIDAALKFRDEKLEEMLDAENRDIRAHPIKRNNDGIAIVGVKIPKSHDVTYALVDDDDYYTLTKIPWWLNKGYASSSSGEMHKLILPTSDGKIVDHINQNRLDNRRENLRAVSYSLNNRNAKKRNGCFSRFIGVSRVKGTGRWQAGISINGKRVALGLFDSEEAAAKRYKEEYQRIEAKELTD